MGLGDEKYVSVATFRKNGAAVATATWIVALDDGRVGFYTSSTSGKAKRLAHTAKVLVQPSDSRGRVKQGTAAVEGTAELVSSGPAFDEVKRKVVDKYGFMTKVTKVLAKIGGIIKRKPQPYADRVVVITIPRA